MPRTRRTPDPVELRPPDSTRLPTVTRAVISDVRSPILVPLLLLLASRALLWAEQPAASEDAYITFRFAKMLVAGHGLVFNVGERVMGCTSPLWACWTALGLALHIDPVGWTRASSVVADCATLVLAVPLLISSFNKAVAWNFAVFFAAWPLFAASAVSGLEIATFLASIVLATYLCARKSKWAGPALALVAVIRPEGLLAAIVISFWGNWRDRVVFALLVISVVLASRVYFGALLPQSLVAKAKIYGTPGPWAGRHWWDWLIPFPMGRFPTTGEGEQLVPLAVVLSAAVVAGLRGLWAKRADATIGAAAAGLAIWAGYSVLGVAYFWWYMAAPLLGLSLAASVGLPTITRGIAIRAATAVFVLGAWWLGLQLYYGPSTAEYNNFAVVSGFISGHCAAGESILLEPIGIIGYFTDLRIIDEVGIVSPDVLRRRVAGSGWYADVVGRTRPDWIVVRREELWGPDAAGGESSPFRSVEERAATLGQYRLVLPADPSAGRTLDVYHRAV